MFNNLTLRTKLLIAFLAVGIIPFSVIGISSLMKSSSALQTQAFNQLEGVRGIKKNQIEQFFAERQGDMGVLVDMVNNVQENASQQLLGIQANKKSAIKLLSEQWYVDIKAQQSRSICTKAMAHYKSYLDTGEQSKEYKRFTSIIDGFIKETGYYDFFVIDTNGIVVHSQAKEAAYKTNLRNGPYSNSGLAKAFNKVMQGANIAIEDFSPYAPSNSELAAFIAAPILKGSERMGVVALQITAEKIQSIVSNRTGQGKTGESYVIAKHNGKISFRSNMTTKGDGKFVVGFDITNRAPEYITNVLAGKNGQDIYTDSRNTLNIVAYTPLELTGLNWGVVTKIQLEEALTHKKKGEEQDFFTKYIEKYGYYDLFLFTPKGKAFYTVTKEADYHTNFQNGKYARSNLGELFRKVSQTKQFGIADFAPYAPSNGDPCAFIAQPVLDGSEVELVVGLQISLDSINKIMQQRDGMGKTGETYLVGSDHLMRSDSFLNPTKHTVKASFANPSQGSIRTDATQAALAGKTDAKIITDYNGNPVLSAYTPLKVGKTTWALIAEIDEAEAFAAIKTLQWLMIIIFVVGMVAIVTLALLIINSIVNPLNQTSEMLSEMEQGHLGRRLNMTRGDAIGIMARSMDSFAENLENVIVKALNQLANGDLTFQAEAKDDQDVIGTALVKTSKDLNVLVAEIMVATEQIASGSGQVADASNSLSQGASEQAASLEQITSSMTEMASQTKTNAENAGQANGLAEETRKAAERGHSQMQDMVTAMGEISESGQNISKIIKTIDEIAFQTNLLALNAAVEAARAGRHGKGFAVVAEEVRNLAARSAKAAKETAELIEGSVEKTNNGSSIANHTAEALDEIVTSVGKVTDLVAEIAAASNEQAEGISQVNIGITQIDQVTQQNTANAEEGASAAEELSSQSAHLKEMMSRFRIKQSAYAMPSQVAPQVNTENAVQPQISAPPPAAPTSKAVNPSDIIDLDDKDFGKF